VYLLARARSRGVEYEDVQRLLPGGHPYSLVDLRRACSTLGVSTRVRKGDPRSLAAGELPVVALMDEGGVGEGRYVVIFGRDASGYHGIDAGYAYYIHLDDETFRRSWSGYVLVPEPWWQRWNGSLWAAVVGCGLLVAHASWRQHRSKRA
jgi:ABC-type bacteriocin/lantibiotic exporter with double-glycine peptidase domain